MSDNAEREYVEAKAAYDAALVRLAAAKKARRSRRWRLAQLQEEVWQAYVDGERDYRALAERFGRSRAWVSNHVRGILRERRFGPETLFEQQMRVSFETINERVLQQMEQNRQNLLRRAALEDQAGHSEAWRRLHQEHVDAAMKADPNAPCVRP